MKFINSLILSVIAYGVLVAILMTPVFVKAQETMPDDMYEFAVPMDFMCVDSFTRMMDILEKIIKRYP